MHRGESVCPPSQCLSASPLHAVTFLLISTSRMRFHTLLCVLLPLLSVHGDSSCTLECRQEAPCVRGNANFSDHPTYQDGTPLPFQVPLQSNGMHCACPHGWTGVTCNRIFESCDGDHKCYNGGNVSEACARVKMSIDNSLLERSRDPLNVKTTVSNIRSLS